MTDRFAVSRQIAAPPAAVFAVLTDPQGHVRIDSSGMLQAAEGEKVVGVGDEFLVHMDMEALNGRPVTYDVRVIITRFEQDAAIEWTTSGPVQPPFGQLYGYTLKHSRAGTLATSYYDWSAIHPYHRQRGFEPVIPEAALRATLGILARTVESSD